MDTLLSVRGLCAGYKQQEIVRGVDLDVRAGQFISIIGPNGAGKSTLLRCLAGVLTPSAGSVMWGDTPLKDFSRRELARMIAGVTDEPLPFAYTVRQIMMMGRFAHMGRFRGPSPQDEEIVQRSLQDTGVAKKQTELFSHLSQGEKQKVLLARALSQCPQLLLLDEPTAHLDLPSHYAVLHMIRTLACQRGIAVVAVIHDVNAAIEFSTELLLLKEGTVLAYGQAEKLLTTDLLHRLYGVDFCLYGGPAGMIVKPAYA